jgi:hypothetical protein
MMNTTQSDVMQAGGCSSTVVAMLAILCLLVGLLVGAGGLFVFLKLDPNNAVKLGIAPSVRAPKAVAEKSKLQVCPACPACERCEAPKPSPSRVDAAPGGGYALVYFIEKTLRVQGQLELSVLQDKILKGRFDFQRCYQERLKESPSLTGELSLQFTVGSSGAVIAAVARHNTTKNAALERCVLDEIRSWTFERSATTRDAVVKFDLLFAPISGAVMPAPP